MPQTEDVTLIAGERELLARAGHLFARAAEVACAANDLHTFAITHPHPELRHAMRNHRADAKHARKLFRPAALLEPSSAQHLRALDAAGVHVRITPHEINETVLLDGRLAILAGDVTDGVRSYSVVSTPEVVRGVASLFDAAWQGGTDLHTYDARVTEIRDLAPRIVELLASGCKDETAARKLGLGLRTYRRRVAELMSALGADSRFQAGARARDLGLV